MKGRKSGGDDVRGGGGDGEVSLDGDGDGLRCGSRRCGDVVWERVDLVDEGRCEGGAAVGGVCDCDLVFVSWICM